MKNFKFFIFTLVLSCRYYSLAGSIPPHINSIAIPIVENQTSEFGISESVTENLLNIFSKENILKITDEEDATSILRGKIVMITDAPYTFTKEEAVTEYGAQVYNYQIRDNLGKLRGSVTASDNWSNLNQVNIIDDFGTNFQNLGGTTTTGGSYGGATSKTYSASGARCSPRVLLWRMFTMLEQ